MVDPKTFLLAMVGVTVVSLFVHLALRRLRGRKLRALAREWGMHYASRDQFHLADRVAMELPCPGAADVRVLDLIYGLRGERFRYVFTAEFTQGVVRTKRRSRRVVSMSEPKDRNGRDARIGDLRVAAEELPIMEQYQSLAMKAV